MKTYAIADLHGRFDLLVKAYDAISAHSDGQPITIVHLGDYIDRGPQSRQVIEWLMDAAALPPWVRRICLRGNHEDIMLECSDKPGLAAQWWMPNGGGHTLLSYGARDGMDMPEALALVPRAHLAWMRSLRRMHVDQHRVFVHAGVKDGIPLDRQDEHDLAWMRYPEGADDGHGSRHVVHGHVQFADGPKVFKNRTDLDTFAWYTGRLAIGVFDDHTPGGAVEFLTVTGEAHVRAAA
jgi:serine/threonine protein phosphatase 1